VLSLPVYDKNRRGTYHKENESSHYHLRGFTHLKAKSHAEEVVAASSQPLEQATEKPQVAGASQATEKPQTTEKAQAAEKTQTTEKAQAAEKTPTSPSSSAFQILVAEDNDLNADIVSSILEDAGYHVTVAEDGLKALETFEASEVGQYGVILMDIQMPVMDGYEATRRIRALNRDDAQNVSIIACTASTFVEDRNAAFASGMNDFLAKPLNVGAMLGKIEAARTSHDSSH
jgi:CheY-like chemotaxis protein